MHERIEFYRGWWAGPVPRAAVGVRPQCDPMRPRMGILSFAKRELAWERVQRTGAIGRRAWPPPPHCAESNGGGPSPSTVCPSCTVAADGTHVVQAEKRDKGAGTRVRVGGGIARTGAFVLLREPARVLLAVAPRGEDASNKRIACGGRAHRDLSSPSGSGRARARAM